MANSDDLREFLLVLRRAMLMVIGWIETRYKLGAEPMYCDECQKRIEGNARR